MGSLGWSEYRCHWSYIVCTFADELGEGVKTIQLAKVENRATRSQARLRVRFMVNTDKREVQSFVRGSHYQRWNT